MTTTSLRSPCQRAAPTQEQVTVLEPAIFPWIGNEPDFSYLSQSPCFENDPAFFPWSEPPCFGNDPADSLTTATLRLQPSETAVAAQLSDNLDLVAQCIAALPTETSAIVAQLLKLCCALADQEIQRNMVAPPMMHSYALPPTSLPIAPQPAAHNLGWNDEAVFTADPTSPVSINAQYADDALAMHPVATTNARPESDIDMDEPTVFLTNSHSMSSTVSPAPKKKGERSTWTKEQVKALKDAVAEFEAEYPGGGPRGKWKAIAAKVPRRNDAQCRQRWEDSDKEGRKKGTWSKTEDKALRAAVEAIEDTTWRRWTTVAEMVPRRTAKQCEYRSKVLAL